MTDEVTYRRIIDRLVADCHQGQGQLNTKNVAKGRWLTLDDKLKADAETLLARLRPDERETVGRMLAEAFEAGVFDVLVAVTEEGLAPFDLAYEGSAFNDFTGRLDNWEWPNS